MSGGRRGGRRGGRAASGSVDKDYDEFIESDVDDDSGGRDVPKDDTLSEGGKMKKLGKVIQRCEEELKRPENVNCRVESFGLINNGFCDKKRKIVKEMGFAGLYASVDRQLSRELAYWLATRVDVPSNCLITLDGKEFPFDPVEVHWVLGIPKGPKPVPKKAVDEDMKIFVQGVVNQFSLTTPSRVRGIPRKNLVDALEAPLEDVVEFKVAFLLLALAVILCPTTSHRLCSTLIPAAFAANDTESYDWCKLVIDQLMYSISSLARRFYPMGFAKGCGGCTIILSTVNVAYGRPHERSAMDVMPVKRRAVASKVVEALLNSVEVEEEDVEELICTQGVRKRVKDGQGYFGWNKASGSCSGDLFVHDYISSGLMCSLVVNNGWEGREWQERGERERKEREEILARERQEREERERKEREEILARERQEREERERKEREGILERERQEREKLEKEKEKQKQNFDKANLEQVNLEQDKQEKENLDQENGEKNDNLDSQENLEREARIIRGPRSLEINDLEIPFCSDDDDAESVHSPSSLNSCGERSRRKRKTTATPRKLVQGYVSCRRPRKYHRFRHCILDYVRVHSNFSPRRQQTVDEDPVMLSCDGHQATLRICAGIGLTRGQVGISMCGWPGGCMKKYRQSGLKVGVEGSCWIPHLRKSADDLDRTTRVYTRQLSGLSPNWINVVFVPVVLDNHWWCVAFSVNREEILVMDSIETSTVTELHSINVKQLAYAMDLVFQLLDPQWPLGTVGSWVNTSLRMGQQGDLYVLFLTVTYMTLRHSCGVHMLAAIKRNAERLLTELSLESDINIKRSWLLFEDLMCDFNEARPAVLEAVVKKK
uniref:Ubiquitin-like protease family profile domain-containing protein n=1 Tax=Chenopodium quinoa TaxID=63459 RepID=A0A803N1Z9_CHEQI